MLVTRRALLKTLAAGGLGFVGGPAAYGYFYERHEISLTRATLPVTGLPPALEGFRIGLITDTHRSRWVSHEDIDQAARAFTRLARQAEKWPAAAGPRGNVEFFIERLLPQPMPRLEAVR